MILWRIPRKEEFSSTLRTRRLAGRYLASAPRAIHTLHSLAKLQFETLPGVVARIIPIIAQIT
jgi:hypothetical protein